MKNQIVSSHDYSQFAYLQSEIVQPASVDCKNPKEGVRLEALRVIELQLQRRAMTSGLESGNFNPLWFLAETERNVYLWRKGHSLAEHAAFEFWVNLESLIDKRLRQIEECRTDNPFCNARWGSDNAGGGDFVRMEQFYLSSFRAAFRQISHHAHALSVATSIAERELCCTRPVILLPVGN